MQDHFVLRVARALLVTHGWCQGAMARDRMRRPVEPTSPDAVAWCPHGAIVAIGGGIGPLTRLRLALDGEPVARFNDNAESLDEVLEVFDTALYDAPLPDDDQEVMH